MISNEARYTNPIMTSVTKRTPRFWDGYKTFLYSKVVNASLLSGLDEQLKGQPWLHCIVLPNTETIVQYIWDTRVVVNVFDSLKVAKAIRSAPWDKCANDAYSIKTGNDMLANPHKIRDAFNAMKMAEDWLEPLISVLHYKNDGNLYEFDISLDVPGVEADTYIGFYHFDAGKGRAELEIEVSLLKDAYPLAGKLGGKWTSSKGGMMTYDDIVDLILNNLTQSKR